MATIDLPPNLKIGDRTDPYLNPRNRSGGAALNGVEQVSGNGTALWMWRAVMVLRNKGDVRSWRSIRAQLDGRVNYLRSRVCDRYRITRREIGVPDRDGAIPYSDDAYHSDGSGFALAQPSTTLSASAAAAASTISILAAPVGGYMTAGVFFSIADWLYVVTGWEEVGPSFSVTFKPPLKAAAASGDVVDFNARAVWVLASDSEGQADLRDGRRGAIELNLVEAIGRDL